MEYSLPAARKICKKVTLTFWFVIFCLIKQSRIVWALGLLCQNTDQFCFLFNWLRHVTWRPCIRASKILKSQLVRQSNISVTKIMLMEQEIHSSTDTPLNWQRSVLVILKVVFNWENERISEINKQCCYIHISHQHEPEVEIDKQRKARLNSEYSRTVVVCGSLKPFQNLVKMGEIQKRNVMCWLQLWDRI